MAELSLHILDSLSSGVLTVDLENRILFINRAMARRMGLDRDKWHGRTAQDLIDYAASKLHTLEGFAALLGWQRFAKEERLRDLEWKDGDTVIHFREKSRPLRDAAGNVIGRLFAYHDISRDKTVDQMKTEFIAVASHELRTPMTSIKGSVDLILSGFAGDISGETQELLEIAQNSCDRLIRLINGILDLAKIEAGQIKLHPTHLDLGDVAEASMRSVKALADKGEVTLTLKRQDALPQVDADKDRMEQVVTNLLSNAIKFAPARTEVRIEVVVDGNWVRCAVVDEGPGIKPDDLERVFGKFQQVGSGHRKGGTGLGLAITQALVNEHRGRIWVESQVGKGAQFIFVLPKLKS